MTASAPEPLTDNAQLRCVVPNDTALRDTITRIITARDEHWLRLNFTAGTPETDDLGFLREMNAILTRLLRLTPGPNTPTFDPLAIRLELARCKLCQVWLDRAAAETNNTRLPGNGAVVSAAKMFFMDRDDSGELTPNESAHHGYGG